MSTFLGPIHHRLYHKILFQEDVIEAIVSAGREAGWEEPEAGLFEACASGDRRPLEEAVDSGNIHRSLQERIEDGERRYARLVSTLLKAHSERLAIIEEAVRALGEAHAVAAETGAEEAHRAISDLLLDGMPCDRVNEIVLQNAECVRWRRTADLHGIYWPEGNAELYDALREALIDGLLSRTRLTFRRAGADSAEISAE